MKINEVIADDAFNKILEVGAIAPPPKLPKVAGSGTTPVTWQGPQSNTWNKDSNTTAQRLNKQGVSGPEIWKQTGNWMGLDGEWRQEIDDGGATWKVDPTQEGVYKLEDVIDHPKLFDAYPELRDTEIVFRHDDNEHSLGSAIRSLNRIEINPNAANHKNGVVRYGDNILDAGTEISTLNTLAHEWQHLIQGGQGGQEPSFSQGSGTANPRTDQVGQAIGKAGHEVPDAFTLYSNHAGEIHARGAGERVWMDEPTRQEFYPGDIMTPDEGDWIATDKAFPNDELQKRSSDTVTVPWQNKTTPRRTVYKYRDPGV